MIIDDKMKAVDEFAKVAAAYAIYRPKYPESLFESFKSKIPKQEDIKTILDVACGSGQFTEALAKHFNKPNQNIIGIDKSIEQLKHAVKAKNIEYRVGTSENMCVNAKSIDIITVAQAAHWFDLPTFFNQAKHALVPNGLLAVMGYAFCTSENPNVKNLISEYQNEIIECWPAACNRRRLDSFFDDFDFGEYFSNVKKEVFLTKKELSVHDFMAYIRTQSALQVYAATHPNKVDPTFALEKGIKIYAANEKVEIVFPFFLFTMQNK